MPEDEDTCALCGGDLVEEEIDPDRAAKLREHDPDLADEEMHAKVCQDCGHVAFHRS